MNSNETTTAAAATEVYNLLVYTAGPLILPVSTYVLLWYALYEPLPAAYTVTAKYSSSSLFSFPQIKNDFFQTVV